jgi:hypothetical protein
MVLSALAQIVRIDILLSAVLFIERAAARPRPFSPCKENLSIHDGIVGLKIRSLTRSTE